MMRVLKWNVPVDDQWHEIGAGRILHVDVQHRQIDTVTVWTLDEADTVYRVPRSVRVFGTGQEVDEDTEYLGTALAADGALVWHMFATADY